LLLLHPLFIYRERVNYFTDKTDELGESKNDRMQTIRLARGANHKNNKVETTVLKRQKNTQNLKSYEKRQTTGKTR